MENDRIYVLTRLGLENISLPEAVNRLEDSGTRLISLDRIPGNYNSRNYRHTPDLESEPKYLIELSQSKDLKPNLGRKYNTALTVVSYSEKFNNTICETLREYSGLQLDLAVPQAILRMQAGYADMFRKMTLQRDLSISC